MWRWLICTCVEKATKGCRCRQEKGGRREEEGRRCRQEKGRRCQEKGCSGGQKEEETGRCCCQEEGNDVGGTDVCITLQQTLATVACGCRVCVAGDCSALREGYVFLWGWCNVLRKCWSIYLLNRQWCNPIWHDLNRSPLAYSPLQKKKSKGKKKKKGKKWVISSKSLNKTCTADTQHRDGGSFFWWLHFFSILIQYVIELFFVSQFLCWCTVSDTEPTHQCLTVPVKFRYFELKTTRKYRSCATSSSRTVLS